MASNKITVDEPLISTDVDNLIRTMAEKKKVSLSDLRHISKIDKKNMDKWITVLEDEGYIGVEYGLSGTYIVWKGLQDSNPVDDYRTSDQSTKTSIENNVNVSTMDHESGSTDHVLEDESSQSNNQSKFDDPYDGDHPVDIEENTSEQQSAEDEDMIPPEAKEEAEEKKQSEFSTETPLAETSENLQEKQEEPDPESLLNKYVIKKRSAGSADMKSSILTSLKNDEPNQTEENTKNSDSVDDLDDNNSDVQSDTYLESVPDSEPITSIDGPDDQDDDDDNEHPETVIAYPEDHEKAVEDVVYADTIDDSESLRPTGTSNRVLASDIREIMNAYMKEINEEKSKISSLQKQREHLYREKFTTLEGRMQADIVTFTEKILEKQSELSKIREGVLELPDKVDEVEQLQKQMSALKKEGYTALERTRKKAEQYIEDVESSKSELLGKVAELSTLIDGQQEKLKELEKASASMDARSEKIADAINDTKQHVSELNIAISALVVDLDQVQKARAEITSAREEIKETVAMHGEELTSLTEELQSVARAEQWVQEYIRDYQNKINDIDEYVSNSENELSDLREAAESLYMKKYLGELENLANAYEDELGDAISREQSIEEKITESRSRITELAKESQQMIKKLKSDVSVADDYDKILNRAREKTSRAKLILNEKGDERKKLVEDANRTVKTKSSGVKRTMAKVKDKKKLSKKKK